MSLGSVTAKNAILDATLGDGRASSIPATFYLAFFNGDPASTGVELTATGGYARTAVACTNAVWGTSTAGQKKNIVAVQSPVSTAAWSATATHIAFCDAASIGAGNIWDCGALDTSVTVSAANTVVRFEAAGITIQVA